MINMSRSISLLGGVVVVSLAGCSGCDSAPLQSNENETGTRIQLPQTVLSSDGRPVSIVDGGDASSRAGEALIFEGSFRLCNPADVPPARTLIEIVRLNRNGTTTTHNEGSSKTQRGDDNAYHFRATIKAPQQPGGYQVIGRLGKYTFVEGHLNVSK